MNIYLILYLSSFIICYGILKYLDNNFKKDKEVVLKSIEEFGEVFMYADESLKKDRDFVLKAIKLNFSVFENADQSFRKDKEICLAAIEKKGENGYMRYPIVDVFEHPLQFIDSSLRNDLDIIRFAIKINPKSFEYLDLKYRKE